MAMNRPMTLLLLLALAPCLSATAAAPSASSQDPAIAAEPATSTDGRPAASEQSAPADKGTAPADTEPAERASSEVFIPTEEISEDFAVSFPVDI